MDPIPPHFLSITPYKIKICMSHVVGECKGLVANHTKEPKTLET